jgi:hypothetical protein
LIASWIFKSITYSRRCKNKELEGQNGENKEGDGYKKATSGAER